jgi:outer membrane lipoprotein LolB
MNAIRPVIILSSCLLSACASHQAQLDQKADQVQNSSQTTADAAVTVSNPKLTSDEKRSSGAASRISSWNVRGSMSAKAKGKGWSATMNWAQHGSNSYQIRLNGPLGGGSVLISRQGGTTTFQDGSKRSSSSNTEALLLQQTGVRIPVNSLYYWVRGVAAPGKPQAERYDNNHHLIQLRQNGYVIDYSQYTVVNGQTLPRSIRLQGNGIMVKLNISSWSI